MINWFKNLMISKKLIIGFLLVAIISVVVGIVGLTNMYRINEGSSLLFNKNALAIAYAGDASTTFQRIRYNALEITVVDTDEERVAIADKLDVFANSIDELFLKYEGTIESEDDASFFNQLCTKWEKYKTYLEEVIKYSNFRTK